jgi:formiminoglutamase
LIGRREFAKARVEKSLQAGCRILTLGGGHDYAYPDLAAFCRQVKKSKKKPFIINFDAHLDVRPDEIKGPHSGTSFYTILKEFPGIEFYEIGIQKWCNSPHHRQWALNQGAKIIDFHDVDQAPKLMKVVKNKVLKKFDKSKHELALSIDIDAFCSAQAPGASQVFPLGLDGHGFLPLLEDIIKKAKPKLMGIYEVNPSFDVDARTSKLAAILSYTFLTNHQ